VRLTMLGPGRALPGDADLVILPGTKSTRGDLAFLRAQGWDAHVAGVAEGAGDASARVQGSYLHGMFRDDAFRAAWLAGFGVTSARQSYGAGVEATLDALAAHMEAHLDVEGLLGIAG
jgi:cobyric acid synthase